MVTMIRIVWNNWFRPPYASVQRRAPSARWGGGPAAPSARLPASGSFNGARSSVSIRPPSARWTSGSHRNSASAPRPAPAPKQRVVEIEAAVHPDQPYAVRFEASGRTIRSEPGEPLLQTALRAGIELSHSCQMGGCGQCRVKALSGSVVMDEPNCLGSDEVEAGYILPCCSYPSSDLVIGTH